MSRGREVLDFARKFRAEHGVGPTVGQIARGLGFFDGSAVCAVLSRLERDGLVEFDRRPLTGHRIVSSMREVEK